ncbi:hypothetical protein [Paenibacillus wynnii]|uniref:Hydrolase n=1 Tax=Paenibacillus wynnii TaxID=268407 RepID=A0A098MAI6_9BACL|nr:hypothetical protein [Paenibacillus wynnii]KGE19559.1 hypothetical protein PWYN_09565 [Paenibacillus wynnii]
MAANEDKKQYFVSVNHGLIQDVRNETGEYEVWLTAEELTDLQDRLKALEQNDEYSFRRAFVPYKSADHDDAIDQFDEKTVRLYENLRQHGTKETQKVIDELGVIPKLENTGYQDKGYGDGSPTNK